MHPNHSTDTDKDFQTALQHHRAGRVPQAEVLYRSIIEADPKHPGALYLLAGIFYQSRKYREAFEFVNRAILEGPDDASARLLLGLSALKLGDSALAIDSINHALALNPDFVEAHSNLGDVLFARGEFARAIGSYEKALALNPRLFETNLNLASVKTRLGKLEEATASYRNALAINPNYSDAHNSLGALLERQGKLDEAFTSVQKALVLNPNHSGAYNNLGALLERQGKLDEAFVSFQKGLALNPNHSAAHNNLGGVLMRQGKLKEAFASVQRALALNPNHSDAHTNLGNLMQIQGEFAAAIASYRRALSIHADDVRAHEGIGFAFNSKGDFGEAVNYFRRAIELGTTNPMTHHRLAALSGKDAGPVPRATVANLFDDYAPRFATHLVDALGYAAPKVMREAVGRLTQDGRRFRHALDLGCGTGLVGAQFRDIVSEIDGVDLSSKMLQQARRTEIYSELYTDEIVDWLERAARESLNFDLVLSGDVFIYVGNLEPTFKAVGSILAGGGLFVFSVEHLSQGSFELLPTGRFAHSASYVRELASTYGFSIDLSDQIDLRKERSTIIPGAVFVLTRLGRLPEA